MVQSVRSINQQFWSSKFAPHLTIRRTYNSTQGYKAHSHAELSVGVIESGGTCLSVKSRQVILEKGDTIFIEPEVVHACNPVQGKPRSYHMLYISHDWCCDMLSTLYGYKIEQFICEHELLSDKAVANKLCDVFNALMEQETENLISEMNSLLFDLVSHCCSPSLEEHDDSELAYQIKNYLLENIVEPPSMDEIAQRLSRPVESVIRIFKRQFGITPKSFLNNNRIEKAKLLLKNGMSIVDVANEVGYADQSQLHRAFVNYTASTPKQYQSGGVNFRQ